MHGSLMCGIIERMPTVEELLAALRAAVQELERDERGLSSITERKAVVLDVLAGRWHGAAGGCAIAEASDDPAFRTVLAKVLDQRVRGNRKRRLFEQWKTAGTKTESKPEAKGAPDRKTEGQATRQRRAEMRRELETLSPDELLAELTKVEAEEQQALRNVARTRTRKKAASGELRRRDRQWRVAVGVSVLAQASADADFGSTLDEVFTRRIADKDRALLARWRDRRAARPAPPKTDEAPPPDADGILLGWVPRKLPDKSWGALRKPPGKDLPSDLVGRSIKVTPRTGEPWITTIVKVVQKNDDSILVQHAGHPRFPSPGENTPAAPTTDVGGDGGERSAER